MKRAILSSLFVLTGLITFAQSSPNPVTWTYSTKKLGSSYEVHMTAKISDGYRIYSQNPGGGITPTKFTFSNSPFLVVEPTVLEFGTPVILEHGMWKVKTRAFEKSVDFVVKVKLKGATKTNLYGKVNFVIGNEKTALTPSKVTFTVPVGR
ncbi:hypothetical protein HB364_29090 [Pseudoflavitalea sp. X16]|uniref:hypothetical protein n=1 Tax=Paraflavitalea devenefica TaxID=2716334 RepID=UPI00142186CF|nr:hypothetical protein [Paraflavitalea devenefica]NII29170.1 hypothetical protein [Paraflavitalea devenefica]